MIEIKISSKWVKAFRSYMWEAVAMKNAFSSIKVKFMTIHRIKIKKTCTNQRFLIEN